MRWTSGSTVSSRRSFRSSTATRARACSWPRATSSRWIYQALFAYRVQFDKDALSRLHMPINIEVEKLAAGEFDAVADEARSWMVLLGVGKPQSRRLRSGLALPGPLGALRGFAHGPRRVRGILQQVRHRPVDRVHERLYRRRPPGRRARRPRPAAAPGGANLYLPQPNYLSAYGGQTIDVTKLEIMEYDPDAQRMWWKTVFSENGSAAPRRRHGLDSARRGGQHAAQRLRAPIVLAAAADRRVAPGSRSRAQERAGDQRL